MTTIHTTREWIHKAQMDMLLLEMIEMKMKVTTVSLARV
jgi:hypothetical protein